MKGKDVLFSHKTDEWETPLDIYQDLDQIFHFTLDPCCTKENQKCMNGLGLDKGGEIRENGFIHIQFDGLDADWSRERCFVNPPHSTIDRWMQKCYEESQKEQTTVVMLVPRRSDRTCWHNYAMKAEEIWDVDKRVSFRGWIRTPGQKGIPDEEADYTFGYAPSTFPSAIVVFDQRRYRACRGVDGEPQCCPFYRTYIQPKNRGRQVA